MRLIDADALLEKLGMLGVSNAYDRPSFWYGKDKKDYKVIPTKYHNGYDNALADVEKAIQELPTIEERKTGKWVRLESGSDGCNQCWTNDFGWARFNYCPNCGAKMKGGAE